MNTVEKSVSNAADAAVKGMFEDIPEKIQDSVKSGNFEFVDLGLGAFELTCFIVPNTPYLLKDNELFVEENIQRNRAFGIETKPGDEVFQVWIAPRNEVFREQDDNWSDHGIPDQWFELFDKENYAPCLLPYSFLKDRKEGESVQLTSSAGFKYRMVFEQLPWRYRRFGRFEEVVGHLHRKSV